MNDADPPPADLAFNRPHFRIPGLAWGSGGMVLVGAQRAGKALLQQAVDRVSEEIGRRREADLEQALTRVLGDGWTPESLAGRTACIAATDTYLLDGRPLLRFSRPRFSQIGQHLQWSMDVEAFDWSLE